MLHHLLASSLVVSEVTCAAVLWRLLDFCWLEAKYNVVEHRSCTAQETNFSVSVACSVVVGATILYLYLRPSKSSLFCLALVGALITDVAEILALAIVWSECVRLRDKTAAVQDTTGLFDWRKELLTPCWVYAAVAATLASYLVILGLYIAHGYRGGVALISPLFVEDSSDALASIELIELGTNTGSRCHENGSDLVVETATFLNSDLPLHKLS